MENLTYASIKQLRYALDSKKINNTELLQFFINRFKLYDGQIGSALEVFAHDSIIKDTEKYTNNSQKTVLSGIPGLIKDNICQEQRTVSCSSKMLEHYKAPYDATVCKRLKSAGAYLLGRANCDEFAMGSSTESSAFQKTANPWDLTKVPGGSSGGSAAAVAAGLVPWALGSETGGSVRQPAALCGLVGLKPTYGLVSRYGLVAYGSSLDQIAPMARTVEDVATVFSYITGKDSQDATSLPVDPYNYTQKLSPVLKQKYTIGIVENALQAEGIENEVAQLLEKAIKHLESLGITIKKISLPTMDYGAAVYFIISRAEAASNLARFDGIRYGNRAQNAHSLNELYTLTRSEGFGFEVTCRMLIGNYVLSAGHAAAYYKNALVVRSLMTEEFENALKDVDALFMPVSGSGAFPFNAFAENALQMDLQDYFTAPANLTGLPALAVPCGFTQQGLPVGFQLMGSRLSEELLLQIAYAYESIEKWYEKKPLPFV